MGFHRTKIPGGTQKMIPKITIDKETGKLVLEFEKKKGQTKK